MEDPKITWKRNGSSRVVQKFYRCCLVQVLQMLFGTSSTDAVWYKFYRCCLVQGKKGWTGLVPLMRCTRVLARQRWFCPCVLTTWPLGGKGMQGVCIWLGLASFFFSSDTLHNSRWVLRLRVMVHNSFWALRMLVTLHHSCWALRMQVTLHNSCWALWI